jgi:hypothetical protein
MARVWKGTPAERERIARATTTKNEANPTPVTREHPCIDEAATVITHGSFSQLIRSSHGTHDEGGQMNAPRHSQQQQHAERARRDPQVAAFLIHSEGYPEPTPRVAFIHFQLPHFPFWCVGFHSDRYRNSLRNPPFPPSPTCMSFRAFETKT